MSGQWPATMALARWLRDEATAHERQSAFVLAMLAPASGYGKGWAIYRRWRAVYANPS